MARPAPQDSQSLSLHRSTLVFTSSAGTTGSDPASSKPGHHFLAVSVLWAKHCHVGRVSVPRAPNPTEQTVTPQGRGDSISHFPERYEYFFVLNAGEREGDILSPFK